MDFRHSGANQTMNQNDTHQVRIEIINNSGSFIGERCYLTGSFNNWVVDDHLIGELPAKGEALSTIIRDVRPGDLELKINRGSWDKLQATPEGKLPLPFSVQVNHDLEISLSIDAWRDEFPSSTASPQVKLLDENFYFPHLDCYRKVWIYLPKNYAESDRSYPVLYMHDGQHLFDEATSVGRAGPVEWMVDETIDAEEGQVLVVAIDHAPTYTQRETEYLLHLTAEVPVVKGEAYLKDIVSVLKPYVDKHYRTKSDRDHTAMLGSSIGGLLSLYAALSYPETFGTLGIFSPSIWMDRSALYQISHERLERSKAAFHGMDFYLYVGGREKRMDSRGKHGSMSRDLQEYAEFLKDHAPIATKLDIDPHGKHGAQAWQQAFKRFFLFWQEKISD